MLIWLHAGPRMYPRGGGGADWVRAPPLAVVRLPRDAGPRGPHNRWRPRGEGSRELTSAEAQERVLGPNKTPQSPAGAPLERAMAPDQEQTGPLGGMGPLELDGPQMKNQWAPRAPGP